MKKIILWMMLIVVLTSFTSARLLQEYTPALINLHKLDVNNEGHAFKFTADGNFDINITTWYANAVTGSPQLRLDIYNGNSTQPSSFLGHLGNVTLASTGDFNNSLGETVTLSQGTLYWGTIICLSCNAGNFVQVSGAATSGDTNNSETTDAGATWSTATAFNAYYRLYGGNTSLPTTIDNTTYNVTSSFLNKTAWTISPNSPSYTYDSTPSVKFNITQAGNCSIGLSNINYTDMVASDSNTECSTTSTTSHTCTLPTSQKLSLGSQYLYISCVGNNLLETGNSTSGGLNITYNLTQTNILNTSITINSVKITFNTNEATNSTIYYGENSSNLVNTASELVDTLHSINLTGLNSSTVYYYNVTSQNNTFTSFNGTFNFTTSTPPPESNETIKSVHCVQFQSSCYDGINKCQLVNDTRYTGDLSLFDEQCFSINLKTNWVLIYLMLLLGLSLIISGYYFRVPSFALFGGLVLLIFGITLVNAYFVMGSVIILIGLFVILSVAYQIR